MPYQNDKQLIPTISVKDGITTYKIEHKIKPVMDWKSEVLTFESIHNGVVDRAISEQIDFKDECVRKALIGLGWTPPEDKLDFDREYYNR